MSGRKQNFTVGFCCNDERGWFTGRVEIIEILDEIRLTGPSKVVRQRAMCIQVGRRRYLFGSWQSCVGNVFWDAVSMTKDDARRLVQYLIESGWGVEEHAESGPFADLARSAI